MLGWEQHAALPHTSLGGCLQFWFQRYADVAVVRVLNAA